MSPSQGSKRFLIKADSQKLLQDEKELYLNHKQTSVSRLGQQKKEMLGKTLNAWLLPSWK